jgi:hypothetical protein
MLFSLHELAGFPKGQSLQHSKALKASKKGSSIFDLHSAESSSISNHSFAIFRNQNFEKLMAADSSDSFPPTM